MRPRRSPGVSLGRGTGDVGPWGLQRCVMSLSVCDTQRAPEVLGAPVWVCLLRVCVRVCVCVCVCVCGCGYPRLYKCRVSAPVCLRENLNVWLCLNLCVMCDVGVVYLRKCERKPMCARSPVSPG